MSIFEEHGWFIPLPDSSSTTSKISQDNDDDSHSIGSNNKKGNKKGKVWSNRNYGADKKRQRKHGEKQMLELRIAQLESVLRNDHGMLDALEQSV